jgi:hypothetical protein
VASLGRAVAAQQPDHPLHVHVGGEPGLAQRGQGARHPFLAAQRAQLVHRQRGLAPRLERFLVGQPHQGLRLILRRHLAHGRGRGAVEHGNPRHLVAGAGELLRHQEGHHPAERPPAQQTGPRRAHAADRLHVARRHHFRGRFLVAHLGQVGRLQAVEGLVAGQVGTAEHLAAHGVHEEGRYPASPGLDGPQGRPAGALAGRASQQRGQGADGGRSNSAERGSSTPSRRRTWLISRTARMECPPSAKKSSSTPTGAAASTSSHSSPSARSAWVAGAA